MHLKLKLFKTELQQFTDKSRCKDILGVLVHEIQNFNSPINKTNDDGKGQQLQGIISFTIYF